MKALWKEGSAVTAQRQLELALQARKKKSFLEASFDRRFLGILICLLLAIARKDPLRLALQEEIAPEVHGEILPPVSKGSALKTSSRCFSACFSLLRKQECVPILHSSARQLQSRFSSCNASACPWCFKVVPALCRVLFTQFRSGRQRSTSRPRYGGGAWEDTARFGEEEADRSTSQ